MKLKLLYTFALVAAILFASAQIPAAGTPAAPVLKKSSTAKQGDNAYGLFNFSLAIKYYSKALKHPVKNEDTLYLVQKIADSYRELNDPANAEVWYKKIVDKKGLNPMNSFWYAEALRANQNYPLAQQDHQQYKAANPTDKNVDEILAGLDNMKELSKDRGLYKIDLLPINSPQSDFGPAFYKDGQIFFTSNRDGRKNSNVSDNWSSNNFYQIYLAACDTTTGAITEVKKINGCKPNGKFHDGPVSYFKGNNELIFTRSNYTTSTAKTAGDKRTVKLKLYSMMFPAKKHKIVSLPFNNDEYSSAHPALSADGKLLYFSSDKLGGQGGMDLYITARDPNGVWSEPQNLGPAINTKYDEKFPYIGYDGTLYYSSNALDGLGGLDIYKTKPENGVWSKPENLGAPVNSSRDDFTFVIDSANKIGYFASNRPNGTGDDDIYHFIYDESKLDYKVTVRVVDANTQAPIPMASLGVDCKTTNPENTLADRTGEKVFTFKGGKPCAVEAMSSGYKPNSAEVTSKKKNTVVIIPLMPDVIKLVITIKEKESLLAVRDAAVSLTPAGNPSVNYATNDNGTIEVSVPVGTYSLTSPDYPSVKGSFSEKDADASGVVHLDFLIPKEEMVINVPLTANCFSTTITVTNVKTGEKNEVSPNAHGEVRLDLKINTVYTIEHGGKLDTVSTVGLKPGMNVEGSCKFYVGQTWVVHNIYYDFNKWNIRPDAAKELDNLVRVMKEHPTLEIELGSHTDCRATAKYNIVLSARRARSAVEYIAKHGIKSKRILAAGYGESVITNGCVCEPTNESPCTDPQHQANRRTEVKVLRY